MVLTCELPDPYQQIEKQEFSMLESNMPNLRDLNKQRSQQTQNAFNNTQFTKTKFQNMSDEQQQEARELQS